MNICYKSLELRSYNIDDMKPGDCFRISKESYEKIKDGGIYCDILNSLNKFLFHSDGMSNYKNIEPLMMCEYRNTNKLKDEPYIINLHTGEMIKLHGSIYGIFKLFECFRYGFSFGECGFSSSMIVTSDGINHAGDLFIDPADMHGQSIRKFIYPVESIQTIVTNVQDILEMVSLKMCIHHKPLGKYYLLDLSSGYFEKPHLQNDNPKFFVKLDSESVNMTFIQIPTEISNE